jgi:glycosyltransferase involved in cell wall biosynthesis
MKLFEKWLYCPVDGHCSDGTLGFQGADVLSGFDRVLAYTRYGADVIEKTMLRWGGVETQIPHLPHGVDSSIFRPRDRKLARQTMISRLTNGVKSGLIQDNQVVLSVVATNSFRKDWGLAFETCAELIRRGHDVLLWGHTDGVQPRMGTALYWDIIALVRQYQMEKRVMITVDRLSDEDMAWGLSAVDCSMGIGSEGWGMPMGEALACGVPVVHMTYAGGADFTPKELQVCPVGYRQEPGWCILRPTFNPMDWADKCELAISPEGKALGKLHEYIDWKNAWPEWLKWLKGE